MALTVRLTYLIVVIIHYLICTLILVVRSVVYLLSSFPATWHMSSFWAPLRLLFIYIPVCVCHVNYNCY